MKVDLVYVLANIPHPWDEQQRKDGVKAWCLCRTMRTALREYTNYEPLAMFNLDSEARIFAEHVFLAGLNGSLVEIDRDLEKLFQTIQGKRG